MQGITDVVFQLPYSLHASRLNSHASHPHRDHQGDLISLPRHDRVVLTPRSTHNPSYHKQSLQHARSGHSLPPISHSSLGASLGLLLAYASVLQKARLALWLQLNRSLGAKSVQDARLLIRTRPQAQPAMPFTAFSFSTHRFAGRASQDP